MKVYIVEYIDDIFELFREFTVAYDFAKKMAGDKQIDSKTKVIKSIDKHEIYFRETEKGDLRIKRKYINMSTR